MDRKPRIAVIIGSTRQARWADKPAAWIMDQTASRDDMDFDLVDLRDFDLPFFDEKASNAWMPSEDERAVHWQKKIGEYDGYLFLVAEYNRSITGALKNALDQAYVEWNRKPMAVFAYGSVGGGRAAEHLRMIAVELQMVPVRSAIHISGSDFYKVTPYGENAPIEAIEGALKGSVKSTFDDLAWWAKATMAARAEA